MSLNDQQDENIFCQYGMKVDPPTCADACVLWPLSHFLPQASGFHSDHSGGFILIALTGHLLMEMHPPGLNREEEKRK